MERIHREGTGELVFKVVSWLFHAPEVLYMDELREAMIIKGGDSDLAFEYLDPPEFIVEECKSLVVYDEQTGVVRFAHSSVHDFMRENMQHRLVKVDELAKVLLTYLSFNIFKFPCNQPFELKDKMQSHKLARYAARWWPEYVRGPGESNPELRRLIINIFRSPNHVLSILQLEAADIQLPRSLTLLHFAAFHQMTVFCDMLCPQDNRAEKLGIMISDPPEVLGTVYSRDAFDETPLQIAARKGYVDIARILIHGGADVDAMSGKSAGLTPLHLAVIRGHNGIVDLLLLHGAKRECKGGYRQETPLLLAAYLGRIDIVRSLLEAGSNVHASIEVVRETGLMRALHSPNAPAILKLLLGASAAVNARDAQGQTALHYAVQLPTFSLCREVLDILLQADADVNIPCNRTGDTVLHVCAKLDLRARRYELDIQNKEEELSSQSLNEIYARQRAISCTRPPKSDELDGEVELAELVELLLRSKADPWAQNFVGDTPLQCSIKMRHPLVSAILLFAMDLKVHFMMDSIGDQEFLDNIIQQIRT